MEVHKEIAESVTDWQPVFEQEFAKNYMDDLREFLTKERKINKIFPPKKLVFNAFTKCSVKNCKVVILGQDPYHGDGQAHGLSFSVPEGIKIPPSLRNIYKELESDMGVKPRASGDLSGWADQGVLLLNASLTVRAHEAGSHQGKGWERFTDECIKYLSLKGSNIVFMLWGNFAISKKTLIDERKHLVLTSTHPSPFSAHRGFLGSKPFSKCNNYLLQQGEKEISW
jgi:uracil-DNA glycosylase